MGDHGHCMTAITTSEEACKQHLGGVGLIRRVVVWDLDPGVGEVLTLNLACG